MNLMTLRPLLALALLAPAVAHAGFGLGDRGPAVGVDLASMQVVDFDGDGHMDIVGLAQGNNDNYAKLAILLGNGDGTFQTPTFHSFGAEFLSQNWPGPQLALADLDGDGDLDVAAITQEGGGRLYLLRNDNGSFSVTARDTGFPAGLLLVAKVDGDDVPDVVVQANSWDPAATVFHGDGAAGILMTSALALAPDQWGAVEFIDLDGNGWDDLVYRTGAGVVARFHYGEGLSSTPTLLFKPDGTDSDSRPLMRKFSFGDFNADGRIDVLPFACDGCRTRLLLQQPDGTFAPLGRVPTFSTKWWVADLDGDGLDDLFAQEHTRVAVRLGRGDGTFTPTVMHPTGANSFKRMVVEDVNGDGIADVVTSGWYGTAVTLGRLDAEGVDLVMDATADARGVELRLRNLGTRATSANARAFLAVIPRKGKLTPGGAPSGCKIYDGSAYGRGLEMTCQSVPSLLPGEEYRARLPFFIRWDRSTMQVRIRGYADTDIDVDIHPENNVLDMTGIIIRPTP